MEANRRCTEETPCFFCGKGRNTMYIDRNISSNAEALVALLLVCALVAVAFV